MKLLEDPFLENIIWFCAINTQRFDHFYKRFSLSLPLQALNSHSDTKLAEFVFAKILTLSQEFLYKAQGIG